MHEILIPLELKECPDWWRNFINENYIEGLKSARVALAEYRGKVNGCMRMDGDEIYSIVFADPADFAFFKLKYSGK